MSGSGGACEKHRPLAAQRADPGLIEDRAIGVASRSETRWRVEHLAELPARL